jgi:hypothetical protein
MNPIRLLLATAALALPVLPASASASAAKVTEAELVAAQKTWCNALVSISRANTDGGQAKAKALAEKIIDEAYGYGLGPVLFKPTLTSGEQTFRTTRAGALAYFVGGDKAFPGDTGFALKGWTACTAKNAAVKVSGDVGLTMGNVMITGADGKVTTVDKTWAFKKTDDGKLRIVLHHSSLPYAK